MRGGAVAWLRRGGTAVLREASHEAQLQWMYAWWERIDEWISENRPEGSPAPEPSLAPTGDEPKLPAE